MEQIKEKKSKKKAKSKKKGSEKYKRKHGSLPECVTHAVEEYFAQLDKAETRDFYDLFIQRVEGPLLTIVMRETNQNQSAAAQMLGLNRGTLRKKLKNHGLL